MKPDMLNRLSKSLRRVALTSAALLACAIVGADAAPKRMLVVCVTAGFRHSAIETGVNVLTQMSKDTGLFTLDVVNVNPNWPEFKGADGKIDNDKLKAANTKALADKMSAEGLKHYDAVFFNSTSGNLPLPDVDAFLSWIRSGNSFIGVHASTDTFGPGTPELHPYSRMIGAVFKTHGAQVEVEAINQDSKHPACKPLASTFKVFDEIYQFNGFERSTVHGLLTLDKHPNNKTPGDYPIAWCKEYGKGKRISAARGAELLAAKTWTSKPGRVFYTSLGHREDVWDPDWTDSKGERKNSPEVAKAFQQHLLGGIKWALGLEKGDAKPQTKRTE